jgi:hypothetical protein
MKIEFNENGSGLLQTEILKIIAGDYENQSMVDLCCGSTPQTGLINFKEKKFVDCVDRELIGGGKLIVSDVIDYLKNNNKKFDVSISTDTIEHFRDNDANVFLDLTSKISKKQIWFTPLGEYCMTKDPNDNNPDSHKSEWTPEKLELRNPNYWAFVVFPNWHPTLGNNGLGAFFFWHCDNIAEDAKRVENELNQLLKN